MSSSLAAPHRKRSSMLAHGVWLDEAEIDRVTALVARVPYLFGSAGVAGAVRYGIMVLFAGAVWPAAFRYMARWGKQD